MVDKQKLIDSLRQRQDVTVGASDWYRLEEEIQELLDEEENGNSKLASRPTNKFKLFVSS